MSGISVQSAAAAGSCTGGRPHCTMAQWFKVVLLGDARVGKTSLLKSLKNDQESQELPKEYKPTAGAWVTYFDLTDRCRLLITDTSGKPEHTSLVNLYLRQLHCVVFVFALDERSSFKSLSHWYDAFNHECTGDVSKVAKFVVGTKTDMQCNTTLQMKAKSFAEEIGAEMWITSAATSFNTHELFARIAKMANTDLASSSLDAEAAPKSDDSLDGPITSLEEYLLDDMFLGKGALVRYPDPFLLNTEGEEISHLVLSHQCVTMTGENKAFKWGTWSKGGSEEAVLKSEGSMTSVNTSSKLWSCVMANSRPSTWQHENLEGVIKFGTTIRRQPTKTEFKGVKKLLFTSRDKLGQERAHGLFYMLLQSEDDTPSEVGLNSVFCKMSGMNFSEERVIENYFRFKPTPVSGSVTCMSMSSSHAAVVNDDNKGVSTWGHGKDGALGLEGHLISNFDPPFPTPVTSINCQVKEVCCGAEFTLMLTNEGQVYSCGSGALGKLGHGDEKNRSLPSLIESLQNIHIQSIAAGGYHAVALTNTGVLYQWGQECANEALTKFTIPTKVNQIDNVHVTSVACGTHHSVCVANGMLYKRVPYAWGRGSHGRLGLGHRENLYVPRLINKLYSTNALVKQVSAGRKHSGFLTVQEEVYTCGNNAFGQLGYFTPSGDSDVPRKVCLGKNSEGEEIRAKELVCKEDYTMILTTDGDVMMWGKCYYGSKLEDPIPLDVKSSPSTDATDQDLSIKDVTTCYVPSGESYIELVVALTNSNNLLFCAGIKPESDCQAMEDRTPQIRCNRSNLTTLCSVGSVLVSMDQQGNAYYVDIWWWLLQLLLLNVGGKKRPTDLTHALFSKLNESDIEHLPTVEFAAVNVCASVVAIEASLSTFVFCSNIGDLYSWSPMRSRDVVHHKELDNAIIVQIACGASHLAALSDNGILYTCGDGRSGQLGFGTFQTTQTFKPVPVTDFHRVQAVCCGWASTAVLTEKGKVFFWGQLDLPKREKARRKQLSITAPTEPTATLQRMEDNGSSPAEYKVEIMGDTGIVQHHLAVVGRPFEVKILPRDGNTSCSPWTEFRAEAIDFQDSKKVHCKGNIKQSQKGDGTYVASLVFYSEGSFRVSITRNGKNVLRSPFKVNAEKGVLTKRSKLSLIGSDIECMRSVGGVLQQAIDARDSGVALWGVPSLTADLPTQETLMLASITDGGIYIYVWDACCGNLSEENLNVWLYLLSLQAPSANVILLGVNISATHANEIDLKPFQNVNPMMKRSIFVGTTFASEPSRLLDEVLLVVSETNYHQNLVWYRLESLASKVLQMKRSRIELLDHSTFKCIAGECGIQRDFLTRKAAEHLESTGMGLRLGGDSFFFVLQPLWLARHLTEIAGSSPFGASERNTLDSTNQHIVNLLIEKRVAVESMNKRTIDIIPYLTLITEVNWPSVDKSNYTIYRHLMLTAPPYHIHSIFQSLAANVLQECSRVTLGKYSLVIYSDQYKYRVDCGPCMVFKTMTEVRVIVRAGSQDICRKGAETAVGFLQRCFAKFGSFYEISVKVSCSWCRQYYVDLLDVQEAATQGKTERECGSCHGERLSVDGLLNGFKDDRLIKELDWHPYHRLQHPGDPNSRDGVHTSNMLLRPQMRYFDDREERLGAKLLKEIKAMFEGMTKVFMDIRNCDVPRTVCLLPEFQRSSVFNTNAIKMLLTYGQPKYRLFLLCEGNGDGTGVHFLDHTKHKGYVLETKAAKDLSEKSVELLRFALQLLISFSSVANFVRGLGLFDVEGTLNNILGTVGLSGTMLCAVPWKNHFKEMDGFLKNIEDVSGSIRQPNDLSTLSGLGRGYQVGGESYAYLRKILSEFGTTDDFGGLRQEPREGIGAIWVCSVHSKYNKDTVAFNVMP